MNLQLLKCKCGHSVTAVADYEAKIVCEQCGDAMCFPQTVDQKKEQDRNKVADFIVTVAEQIRSGVLNVHGVGFKHSKDVDVLGEMSATLEAGKDQYFIIHMSKKEGK